MAEPAADWVGRKIGHFVVDRPLGKGGMGVVYLLRHQQLPNTLAALKVLRPELADAPSMRGRFVQEALVAAALGGHRVARPLDLGRLDDGTHYIIMEYVAGRTLADHLEAGALPLRAALKIAYRVADIMALAHARDILHRDLKPSNVMLVGDDIESAVKLLDFGVARVAGELKLAETQENAIIGSPGYMSPEAAAGLPLDGESDVFSLGVMLYKMLTGELPFAPALDRASVAALLAAEMPPLSGKRPAHLDAVPAEIESLLRAALSKEAAERPSMAELRDALLAALRAGSPGEALSIVEAEPPSPLPTAADELAPTLTVGGESADDLAALKARLEEFCFTRAPDAQPAPAPAPPRRRWIWLAAALVPLIAFAIGWRIRAAHRSPLLDDHSSLAIPPLNVEGVEPPAGWLGAAAAEEISHRAGDLLSGRDTSVMEPGELIGLPHFPSESFPVDPWAAPDARDHAIEVARARADVWMDGVVRRISSQFEVTLLLRRRDGTTLAESTGKDRHLDRACIQAIDGLDARAFPRAASLTDEVRRWAAIQDMETLMLQSDSTLNNKEACEGYYRRRKQLGAAEPLYAFDCSQHLPDWLRSLPPPRLDKSFPGATISSAIDLLNRGSDPKALREALTELERLGREEHPPPQAEPDLLVNRARLLGRLGERAQAQEVALAAVKLQPMGLGVWGTLNEFADSATQVWIARAASAWLPLDPSWWLARGYREQQNDVKLMFARRAVELDPDNLDTGLMVGKLLIRAGRNSEARAIASSYAGPSEDQREVRALLLSWIDFDEGRFGAALERLRASIMTRTPGHFSAAANQSIFFAHQIAELVGGARELDDAWVERYVLPGQDDQLGLKESLEVVVATCFNASPRLARRCATTLAARFDRKQQRLYEWYFGSDHLLDALDAWVAGDRPAVLRALRPLLKETEPALMYVPLEALPSPEAADLVERRDALRLERKAFAGLALGTPRAAEKAFAKGDLKTARELAQSVVDRWGKADVPVPAVAEMRALLDKISKQKE
jgi:eukaryotic-like serine/threonine-protein kinase